MSTGRRLTLARSLLAVLCISHIAAALKCWKCENTDLFGCRFKGTIEICNEAENESCQTEVRYMEARSVIIRTGCKQGSACKHNSYQNPAAAWSPSQCNPEKRNSVCRCCCDGNMCNRKSRSLLCKFPPINTVAALKNPPIPPKTCESLPDEVENGIVNCNGGVKLRAFCTFKCLEGYRLVGNTITICVERGNKAVWNQKAPKCIKEDVCGELPPHPDNGWRQCDGEGKVGTTCTYTCNYGFKLEGPAENQCYKTPSGAVWSEPNPPTCTKLTCKRFPKRPENGAMECTAARKLGSVCDFTCDYGHELIGHESTACKVTPSGDAAWDLDTPVCEKLKCKFMPREPQNGFKECIGEGEVGTVCNFACNFGYQLMGSPSTLCNKTLSGMRWSHRTPTCKPLCKTLPHEPMNGFMTCSNGRSVGSECVFECNSGHRLTGHISTSCKEEDDGSDAFWSHDSPSCQPFCSLLPLTPANGDRECSGDGGVGTTCFFRCKTGYKLVGDEMVACEQTTFGADWDATPPTCLPFCEPLPEDPINGERVCNGAGEIGTSCTFECNPGYRIDGAQQTTCHMTNKGPQWSHQGPTCEAFCDTLSSMANGSVSCDGNGKVGTKCAFGCDSYEFMLSGSEDIECVATDHGAEWNKPVPMCLVRPVCASLGNLENGQITCDKSVNEEGTTCSFECFGEEFSLVPENRQFATCNAALEWTSPKPCCVDCSRVKMDIMIAMDSSGSIQLDEWGDMRAFVQNLVRRFRISEDEAQFSIFQFSSGPRSDGFMYFGRHNKHQLIRQVGKMRRMGTGTMTGRALEYALKRFDDSGSRPDVPKMLLILTDGEAEDMDDVKKFARKLRRNGVEILALAIGPTENFVGQMTMVTGSRDKVLEADNIADLTDDLVDTLFRRTCSDPNRCDSGK